MKCIQCFTELPSYYNFCYNCGLKVFEEPEVEEIPDGKPKFSPLGTLPSEVSIEKLEKLVQDYMKEHGNLFTFLFDPEDHVRILTYENVDGKRMVKIPDFVYGFASLEDANGVHPFQSVGNLETIHLGEGMRDLSNMFVETELEEIDVSDWDVTQIINMKQAFCSKNLKSIGDLKDWDVSHVLTMESMFAESSIKSPGDLTHWNVSHVQDFSFMFSNSQLTTAGDLSLWNVSRAKHMYGMFRSSKLTIIGDLSAWDVSNVLDMGVMFSHSLIRSIGDVSGWNTGKVKSLAGTFSHTKMETIGHISNWDVGSVTTLAGIFTHATMESVGDLFNWDVSNVITMENMFAHSNFNFCGDLSTWDMSAVKNMKNMFTGTDMTYLGEISNWDIRVDVPMHGIFDRSKLTQFSYSEKALRDSFPSNQHRDDLQKIIDDYHGIYGKSLSFEIDEKARIRISAFKNINHQKILNIPDFVYGFSNSPFQDPGLLEVINLGQGLRDLSHMLQKCPLKNLDLTEWNVSKINRCERLFAHSKIINVGNLNSWNTYNCFSMEGMFQNSQVKDVGDIEKWNVVHVKSMKDMFQNSVLEERDKIPEWYKTSKKK